MTTLKTNPNVICDSIKYRDPLMLETPGWSRGWRQ